MQPIYLDDKTAKSKFKKAQKKWLIAICVFSIIATGFFFRNYLIMGYYYAFKVDNFEVGDKVYITQEYYNDIPNGILLTLQMIRPLTKEDLRTMHFPSYRPGIVSSPNDTLKPYLRFSGAFFEVNKMRQNKSGFIGTFKGYKLVTIKDFSTKKFIKGLYAVVVPNNKVFSKVDSSSFAPAPNYILADSTFYVFPFHISKHELTKF